MDRIKGLGIDGCYEVYITARPLLVRLDLTTRSIEIMPHVQEELLNDIEEQDDEE